MTDEQTLTGKQDHVIGLLLAGQRQKEAAAEADVSEETVSRWINHDPLFVATLNARREELWRSRVERLRGLADKALDVYDDVLSGRLTVESTSVALRAAKDVLGAVASVGRPEGQTRADDVEVEWARADEARELGQLITPGFYQRANRRVNLRRDRSAD